MSSAKSFKLDLSKILSCGKELSRYKMTPNFVVNIMLKKINVL